MSQHATPIVPTILFVGDQRHPWKLAELTRHSVTYHTPTTVRLLGSMTRHQHQVYCLENDAAWEKVQATQASLQQALDALADGLRSLGSYAKRLSDAGGMKSAPNPLCSTVISAPDPDTADEGYWFTGRLVPRIERESLSEHTPKMLRRPSAYNGSLITFSQRDHFVCPDDAAWAAIEALIAAAQEKAQAWERLLRELGTYQAALADGRYARKEESMAASMPAHALTVADRPIDGVPMMDQAEARATLDAMRSDLGQIELSLSSFRQRAFEFADRQGWKALGYSGAAEAINAELGTQYSKSYLSRLMKAAEIEKILELPMDNSTPERVLREFSALDTPDQQRQAWQIATAATGGKPTAKAVEQAVAEIKPKPAPALHPDYQHMAEVERILKEVANQGEHTGTRLYQAAYDAARQIRDVTLYNRAFAAIDRAIDDQADARQAKPKIPEVATPTPYAEARTFVTQQRASLAKWSRNAMVSQAAYRQALDHIDALLRLCDAQ